MTAFHRRHCRAMSERSEVATLAGGSISFARLIGGLCARGTAFLVVAFWIEIRSSCDTFNRGPGDWGRLADCRDGCRQRF